MSPRDTHRVIRLGSRLLLSQSRMLETRVKPPEVRPAEERLLNFASPKNAASSSCIFRGYKSGCSAAIPSHCSVWLLLKSSSSFSAAAAAAAAVSQSTFASLNANPRSAHPAKKTVFEHQLFLRCSGFHGVQMLLLRCRRRRRQRGQSRSRHKVGDRY